ncbi:hypothetical protein [Labedaea rhizosphaerae]|uniref:Uncharacterized protein n=1 Tax=Labedaea rhizosphaerae TaxID=598644 RepID=A0A4R6SCA7_LABRH|nr:hypothetical protein [Labedaea rhizosphaerae]TDP97147.1 hypothetical protein EV186_103108 [Labedaea rhizosphaerae]
MTEEDPKQLTAMTRRPLEVWLAMGVNAGAALVFLLVAIVRQITEGGSGLLPVPIYLLVLAVVAVALLIWRPRNVQLLFGIAAVLPVLLHLLVVMGNQVWWLRTLSGVLAAAYLYSVVLVNTKPARMHLAGRA